MAVKLRKLAKKTFIILNIVPTVLMAIVCLVPWLHAGKFWWAALLGLGFPLLLALQVGFLIFWLLFRSRWAFMPLISLLLSFQQIGVLFAFGSESEFGVKKKKGTFRVVSWNVSLWDEYNRQKKGTSYRQNMLDLLAKSDADVFCFQEFFESKNQQKHKPTIVEFTQKMGYPYHYFAVEGERYKGSYRSGILIFSKHPIIDSMRIRFRNNSRAESLVACDIRVNGKVYRIATTHLQSVLFDSKDYEGISQFGKTEKATIETPRAIVPKLRRAYVYRSTQAEQVSAFLDSTDVPVILTGDFNDVPNSYTYFKIRKDMQDAFLEKGFGMGRTFRKISPTLRIDYIFADPRIAIEGFGLKKVPYSDHYPLMADFVLP